jgi:hypothetical protein
MQYVRQALPHELRLMQFVRQALPRKLPLMQLVIQHSSTGCFQLSEMPLPKRRNDPIRRKLDKPVA